MTVVREGETTTSNQSLYLNGELLTTNTGTNSLSSGMDSIGTFAGDTSQRSWHGEIDELQIWDKALTQDEIIDRMYRSIDQTDPLWSDLSGYYKMDWGQGNTAYDYSANANDGALNQRSRMDGSLFLGTWNGGALSS